MGFMDFLKKESKDLKFKDNKSNDSFDSIPPPPKEGTQNRPPSDTSKEESSQSSMPSFPDAKDTRPSSSDNEKSPFAQEPSSEQLNTEQDHTEFMPPGNFDEQPKSPENYMSKDIGWSQDPAYTNDQSMPETSFSEQSQNPFEDEQESDEDLSLPDLPDIPTSAMSESLGANVEETKESSKQKGFDGTQDKMSAQKPSIPEERPEPQRHEENSEQQDSLPELEADYLPEDEAVKGEKEQFVESYQFYETLQDIKSLKRSFKDAEMIMKEWSELDYKAEQEARKFIETIDTLQEEMIKIDSTLFEEG